MYSVLDYGRMLADGVRVAAYREALAAAVRPGAVVVDLGAGTGFFALEACRLGAGKVYAIETNDAIGILPALARRNGFADRIEVIQRPSTEVTLARKADVIVADLRGVVPIFEANAAVMADARSRLLAPGGVMIPERDTLFAAVLEAPAAYARLAGGWEGHGLDLSDARAACLHAFASDRDAPFRPEQLVTAGAPWAELVYGAEAPALFERSVELAVTRSATAHGVVLWFDAILHGMIGYSTAPGYDRVYGRAFLPWEEPVDVEIGDAVTLDLCARRAADDHVWAWSTTVRRGEAVRASFRQSTFLATVTTAASLMKEASSYAPRLGAGGRATAAILAAMDGSASVADIARDAHERHPGAFASADEALEAVRRLAKKYG
ncbi:MAG: 50S ribosomal protein L11 methyltransferase [Labilithrix sp.]|nr:50S ribosomal protein L11 methyltransferase [Labilithrix sp.]